MRVFKLLELDDSVTRLSIVWIRPSTHPVFHESIMQLPHVLETGLHVALDQKNIRTVDFVIDATLNLTLTESTALIESIASAASACLSCKTVTHLTFVMFPPNEQDIPLPAFETFLETLKSNTTLQLLMLSTRMDEAFLSSLLTAVQASSLHMLTLDVHNISTWSMQAVQLLMIFLKQAPSTLKNVRIKTGPRQKPDAFSRLEKNPLVSFY